MVELQRGKDNRLELLLFDLGGRQRFGINVLKVKEVIACPHLTQVPHSHPAIRGVAHLRGEPLIVVDLAQAIGREPLAADASGVCSGSIIITEFNRRMQGFLINRVDRIVICDWKSVLPPPRSAGSGSYITGVTTIDNALIQLLDVEKALGEVIDTASEPEEPCELSSVDIQLAQGRRVLVVDDSSLARSQTVNTLTELGIECVLARNGVEAMAQLHKLNGAVAEGPPVDMVLSDIEMPEMDGYALTRAIRAEPALKELYTLLHTSLNGAINAEKAHKAGANDILTKFVPEELAKAVVEGLRRAR